MCHLAAMQPCSMVALLLAVQIISIQPVKGSDDEDHEMMDGIIPYLIKSAQYYIQHEKEKLSILPLPGYAVMYTLYTILQHYYFDLLFVTFVLHCRGKPEDHNDSDEDSNGSWGEDEYGEDYEDDEDGPPFKGWKPVSDARLRRWCRRAYRWSNWCCNTYRINCHFVQYS